MKSLISCKSGGNKSSITGYPRPNTKQSSIFKRLNSSQSASNNKTLIISNRSHLELLQQSRHETIIFDTMSNVRFPTKFDRETQLPTFARNLVLHRCDKNLVYFANHSYYFSPIENVYMNSPCDPCVLPRLSNSYINVYLTPPFHQYKDRWAAGLPRIHNIPEQLYNELLKAFGYRNVW